MNAHLSSVRPLACVFKSYGHNYLGYMPSMS